MFDKTETPLVYLITEGKAIADNFNETSERILKLIEHAVENRISLVQIREKFLTARLSFELARRAAEVTKNSETKLLVNDRADVAFAAGADGVHLTEKSVSAETIRRYFPKDFVIGASCHTLAAVLKAKSEKADFAVFSPIFPTPNKAAAQGIEKLNAVCSAAADFPVFALGGIDETNFEQMLKAGARGVAAIRLLNDAQRLSKFAGKIRQIENS